jgi:hypothetical protein
MQDGGLLKGGGEEKGCEEESRETGSEAASGER